MQKKESKRITGSTGFAVLTLKKEVNYGRKC